MPKKKKETKLSHKTVPWTNETPTAVLLCRYGSLIFAWFVCTELLPCTRQAIEHAPLIEIFHSTVQNTFTVLRFIPSSSKFCYLCKTINLF